MEWRQKMDNKKKNNSLLYSPNKIVVVSIGPRLALNDRVDAHRGEFLRTIAVTLAAEHAVTCCQQAEVQVTATNIIILYHFLNKTRNILIQTTKNITFFLCCSRLKKRNRFCESTLSPFRIIGISSQPISITVVIWTQISEASRRYYSVGLPPTIKLASELGSKPWIPPQSTVTNRATGQLSTFF